MHFTLPPNERGLDELLGYYLALCYNKSLCSQNRSNGIITGTIHTLNIYTILFYVMYTELDEAICISHIILFHYEMWKSVTPTEKYNTRLTVHNFLCS